MRSTKCVFLKISQNSQETACAGFSFAIILQAFSLQFYVKRDSSRGVWRAIPPKINNFFPACILFLCITKHI